MKYSIVFVAIMLVMTYAHFDFSHHQNGHQLTVTLKDETQKIWVVFIEKSDPAKSDLLNKNKDLKNKIKQRIYNEDVYYTELDLFDAKDQKVKDYDEFISLVGIKSELSRLDEGPIVALVYNKKGFWIHGEGIPQETVDTIHAFILQKQDSQTKNKPISIGGPTNHPSSFTSFEN